MAHGSRADAHAESIHVHDTTPPPPATKTTRTVAIVATLLALAVITVGVVARFKREAHNAEVRGRALQERRATANQPPEVELTSPVSVAYSPHFSITGTLDPVQEATLGFNVPGRLATIEVTLGQRVEAGQLLATLDRRTIGAQSALAGAAVQAGDVQVQMANDRLRRVEALHERGAIADQELESARQALSLATAQLSQAQAQTRVVSADGSNHLLRAPFAGVITQVPGGVGNVVQPGQTLFRLEDLTSVVLRSGITERALGRIAIGDGVTLEQFPQLRGQVRAFARSLDPITRRAPVEIAFSNESGALVGHMLVKGRIESNRPIPSMRVPTSAVRENGTVLVVDGENRIAERHVESLAEADGTTMVFFGLTERDRVVVRPTPDLTVGMNVRPATPRANAPAAANAQAPANAGR